MALLIFIAALCALAGLAPRFGHDSRETADSKEEALGRLGVSSVSVDAQRPAEAASSTPLRHTANTSQVNLKAKSLAV